MKLILKLIAGIGLGILIGLFAPDWIIRLLLTFKGLFGQLLFFIIPLLIPVLHHRRNRRPAQGLGPLAGPDPGSRLSVDHSGCTLAFLVAR